MNSSMSRVINGKIVTTVPISANTVSFTLPLCPPSVNSLYTINYKEPNPSRRVNLRPECRRWKSDAKGYMPRFRIALDSIVQVDRTYYYPWFEKTGKWPKKNLWDWEKLQEIISQELLPSFLERGLIRFRNADAFNMDKLLYDTIAERIGIDAKKEGDCRFKAGMMRSVNAKIERTEVRLIEIRLEDWRRNHA